MLILKRVVIIKGFCPTQNSDYRIKVTYIDASDFENQNSYDRGTCKCDYIAFAQNDCLIKSNCPILEKAPKQKIF